MSGFGEFLKNAAIAGFKRKNASSNSGNTIALCGDSITHNNFRQSTITGISRTNNVVTVTLSSAATTGPGLPVQVVGVPEDMRGNQVVTGVSGNTFTYANVGPDVASGSLGSNPRVANMSSYVDVGIFVWTNILSNQKFDIVAVSASTGRYSAEALARISEIISAAPARCWVMIGTNDCGAAESTISMASIQANIIAIWTALLSAGIEVIACTIPPQSAPSWNATLAARVNILNEWIRTNAKLTNGVRLVDIYARMVDPMNANKGTAKTGYMIAGDGLHPSPRGCYYAGKGAAADLADIPQVDLRTTNNGDNYGTNSANRNLLDSAPWTNTGGGIAGTATGTTGANWTCQGNGSAVVNCTPTLRSDGFGYDHVVTAKAQANGDTFYLYGGGSIVPRLPAAPFSLRLLQTVSVSGMQAANYTVLNTYMPMTLGGVTNRNIEALGGTGSSAAEAVDEDWTGVIATPKIAFSSVRPTTLSIYNQPINVGASANTATFRYGRASLLWS